MTTSARALPRLGGVARSSAAAIACAWCAIALVIAVAAGGLGLPLERSAGAGDELPDPPSALARRDIPLEYLRLYVQAARASGVDWAVLAAIGKVECNHGRDPDPSCTRVGAANAAGAAGPMQFLAPTWERYGRDGDGDGNASRWDPADAIYSAAAYLSANGAPRETSRAIFAYNHARWYVSEVEDWAARYRSSSAGVARSSTAARDAPAAALIDATATPVAFVEGQRARLAPWDRHLALIPAAAPPMVQAMIIAGNELQDLPYGPDGHPDPRGALDEDCSSTINYVLYRAGARSIAEILRENPLAQDYVRWGSPGPGRWVSIYAASAPLAHVFVVIAGLRLDTSHRGTDAGPNRAEDGPRWRVSAGIPAWAHWSVRHPPGL